MNGRNPQSVAFVAGMPVINNLNFAQSYAVNLNTAEAITQSLYDSNAYPTTGVNVLNFFQGTGANGVISAAAKTLEDTNVQNGSLPNLQAFVVTSIELDVQPAIPFVAGPTAADPAFFGVAAVASSINDVWKIRTSGALVFNIGSKPYLQEGPLMKFPASNDFEIDGAVALYDSAAEHVAQALYAKSVGPSYQLAPNNLLLIPLQQFQISLQWATLQTVTTAARIFARLMGQLFRMAQ